MAGEVEPPDAVRAVLQEYFGALAAEPNVARVVLVEVLGAGSEAWSRRDRSLEARVALIAGGDEGSDSLLAVFGAADELARARLRAGTLSDLPALAPLVASMLVQTRSTGIVTANPSRRTVNRWH